MTLNGHFACTLLQNTCVYGGNHEHLNEDRPTLSAGKDVPRGMQECITDVPPRRWWLSGLHLRLDQGTRAQVRKVDSSSTDWWNCGSVWSSFFGCLHLRRSLVAHPVRWRHHTTAWLLRGLVSCGYFRWTSTAAWRRGTRDAGVGRGVIQSHRRQRRRRRWRHRNRRLRVKLLRTVRPTDVKLRHIRHLQTVFTWLWCY